MNLKIKRLTKTSKIPTYANPSDAGMDLYADEEKSFKPGGYGLVRTGIAIEIPEGYEGQIRPRSGLAAKYGISLVNSPGTIDTGYRGELQVVVINHGNTSFQVTRGMRIAQMVVAPYEQAKIMEVETLSEATRNEQGFGSTGTH